MQSTVHFLFEALLLAHIPRTGFSFLGTGKQSVAEHSYGVVIVAHILADLTTEPIDRYKLLLLCLFHDLAEVRTGDLNYVNKRYVEAHAHKALEDIEKGSIHGPEIAKLMAEYDEKKTLESKLAHDADQIELLLVLKKESDTGNPSALKWFDNVSKRITTDVGKKMVGEIRTTPFDEWWTQKQ